MSRRTRVLRGRTFFRAVLTIVAVISLTIAGTVTASAVSAPPMPANVKAVAVDQHTVKVSWSPSAGATGYVVSNGTSSAPDVPASRTSLDWGSLAPGSYMCFTVAAKNAAGQSAWSPYACATTPSDVPPPVPTGSAAVTLDQRTSQISWTAHGDSQYIVTNGNTDSAVLPAGSTSYTWGGQRPGEYLCFAVIALNAGGYSDWTPYSCTTTPTWTEDAARQDLISHITNLSGTVAYNVKDDAAPPHTMDTAKVIQVGQSYYAVYSSGGQPVRLATATTPTGPWHVVTALDDQNGSQPYLAQEPDGSFLLADEHVYNAFGDSSVLFKQYANLRALENADAVRQFQTTHLLSACREGTPDIHLVSADGTRIEVGLHWNSTCDGNGLDRAAYGTLTDFANWTEVKDTGRDDALLNAVGGGFPGKHGDRDDIWWHGYRFSLQEAQKTKTSTEVFDNWGLALYDYGNHTAYRVDLPFPNGRPSCVANPTIGLMTDPVGNQVLTVTAFIFSQCVPKGSGLENELIYTVPV